MSSALERMDQRAWNECTRALLEDAYLHGKTGPKGSGCSRDEVGWERVRRPSPMHSIGAERGSTWDVPTGYLMQTLPAWVSERGFTIEPFGLELIPTVADLARAQLPHLADRIFAGDVMEWGPPRRWTFVTALTDAVPPFGLGGLVRRLLEEFAEPGGRIIVSSYGSASGRVLADPVDDRLTALGFDVSGSSDARADNGVHLTQTAWMDRRD